MPSRCRLTPRCLSLPLAPNAGATQGRLGVIGEPSGSDSAPEPLTLQSGCSHPPAGEPPPAEPCRRLRHLEPPVAAAAPAVVGLAGPDLFDDLVGVFDVELVPIGPQLGP